MARQGHLDSGARDVAVRRRVLVREEERGRQAYLPKTVTVSATLTGGFEPS